MSPEPHLGRRGLPSSAGAVLRWAHAARPPAGTDTAGCPPLCLRGNQPLALRRDIAHGIDAPALEAVCLARVSAAFGARVLPINTLLPLTPPHRLSCVGGRPTPEGHWRPRGAARRFYGARRACTLGSALAHDLPVRTWPALIATLCAAGCARSWVTAVGAPPAACLPAFMTSWSWHLVNTPPTNMVVS